MSNKQKKLESFINGNIEKVRLENGQISWKKLGKLILEEFQERMFIKKELEVFIESLQTLYIKSGVIKNKR